MLIFGQDVSFTCSCGNGDVSLVQGQPVFPSGGAGSSERVGQCMANYGLFQPICILLPVSYCRRLGILEPSFLFQTGASHPLPLPAPFATDSYHHQAAR